MKKTRSVSEDRKRETGAEKKPNQPTPNN